MALTEDHATLSPRWCRTAVELLEKHPELGAVGGAVECGSNRMLNRAICYCDFGRYQNPLPEGPARFVSDSNVVYRCQALDEIRSVWDGGFREFPVHQALVERGRPIWLTPRITAWQNRVEMTLGEALKERYVWGRAFAGIRFDGSTVGRRLIYAGLSPGSARSADAPAAPQGSRPSRQRLGRVPRRAAPHRPTDFVLGVGRIRRLHRRVGRSCDAPPAQPSAALE